MRGRPDRSLIVGLSSAAPWGLLAASLMFARPASAQDAAANAKAVPKSRRRGTTDQAWARGSVAALGLGKRDPVYGYPAPRWFQELEALCTASSGPLVGQIETAPGVHLRCFDRGVVALNGSPSARKVKLPLASNELKTPDAIVDVRTEKSYTMRADAGAIEVEVPAWSGRVFAARQAFELAKARKLPDKPKVWKAPLLPGIKVAPLEVILEGPSAFLEWHRGPQN